MAEVNGLFNNWPQKFCKAIEAGGWGPWHATVTPAYASASLMNKRARPWANDADDYYRAAWEDSLLNEALPVDLILILFAWKVLCNFKYFVEFTDCKSGSLT